MTTIPEWIDVTEQLPEEDGEYLCSCLNESIAIYMYKCDDGWHELDEFKDDPLDTWVTHWMPLPNAPRPLTKEEQFKQNMQYVCDYYSDIEIRHCEMDRLMAQTLRDLGYGEGVDIFDNTSKWYA